MSQYKNPNIKTIKIVPTNRLILKNNKHIILNGQSHDFGQVQELG